MKKKLHFIPHIFIHTFIYIYIKFNCCRNNGILKITGGTQKISTFNVEKDFTDAEKDIF